MSLKCFVSLELIALTSSITVSHFAAIHTGP